MEYAMLAVCAILGAGFYCVCSVLSRVETVLMDLYYIALDCVEEEESWGVDSDEVDGE